MRGDGEFRFPYPTHGPDSPGEEPFYAARPAVAGAAVLPSSGLGGRYGHLLRDIPPGLNYSFFTAKLGHPRPVFAWRSKFSDFLYKADPDAPVRTLKAQGGQYTGPFSWENRPFSVSELKRLQTIPDSYEIAGGRQAAIEQIGNSVPPQFARMLAVAIRHQFFGETLPFAMRYMDPGHSLGFRKRKRALTAIYQAKAREAHLSAREPVAENSLLPTGAWTRHLTGDFALLTSAARPGLQIEFDAAQRRDEWKLTARVAGCGEPRESFTVDVMPVDDWPLTVRSVRLEGIGAESLLLTALWKALEECVRDSCGVADLVQLNGYYQYEPRLTAAMSVLHLDGPLWQALHAVSMGKTVGDVLAGESYARAWGLAGGVDGAVRCLRAMKRIGFEVRSHRTNPQIHAGHYLIPYAFPTLTPQSVQLRKKL